MAYVSGAAGLDPQVLRARVAARLPRYLVPAVVMVLEGGLPLSSSGKVDRAGLPVPGPGSVAAYRAPRSGVEQVVAAVFAEVLGVDRVGLDDDFFALGGDSLVATRVVARLGRVLGVGVPVRGLFDASTVGGLAEFLVAHRGARVRPVLVGRPRPDVVPLSFAQQRLWFLNRLDPGAPTYVMAAAFRVVGALDVAALGAALGDVIARHEVLRTVYPAVDGVPTQRVLPAQPVVLTAVDVEPGGLGRAVAEFAGGGFDLAVEQPWRVRLLRTGADEHVLVLMVHHIAFDGWSVGPLTEQIAVAYSARRAGGEPGWSALPVQYADYALWQRELLGSESDPDSVIAEQGRFWAAQLAGMSGLLELPTDRPRPRVASQRGDVVPVRIDPQVWAGVKELARGRSASAFMVVHAALVAALMRWSGVGDIAIGTPVADRGDAALDGLVGMLVNTVVLRAQVGPADTFEDVLVRVRDGDLSALAHADLPFERLVEMVNPERSQGHSPLFQVMLAFQGQPGPDSGVAGFGGVAGRNLRNGSAF